MYPRIPREVAVDPLGYAVHSLRTSGIVFLVSLTERRHTVNSVFMKCDACLRAEGIHLQRRLHIGVEPCH
jgi:hypothetical protein